ncbi:MAG: M24 family metallopeptidase [Deltaproteobacteria bacterium]|nr:M24 family metallopeptidase [Deltaproteobacteria bacterium]
MSRPIHEDLPSFDRAARRAAVLERIGSGVAVIRAPSLRVHANDVEYRYRPDSDLFYLTGFPEPDAVLVLDGSAERERCVLFVQPRDPERETWTGKRAGVEGAVSCYGADAAYPMAELAQRLTPLIARGGALYYHLGHDEPFNQKLLQIARAGWAQRPRTSNDLPTSLLSTGALVHELRLYKSPEEIAWMQRAIDIAAEAHRAAMREVRPGMYEHEIEALVEYVFRRNGASGWAYPSIVAGGENATVLHYTANDRPLRDGDLLLLDAGDELGCYCADVTRTFPVGRAFSPAQRRVYDLVLQAQLAAVAAVKPGVTIEDVHAAALQVLVDGLLSLGLLAGTREQAIGAGSYKPYYMHRTSHWLGMDVHDVGTYKRDGAPRPLEPGMVLTVEPGLYFASPLPGVPAEYRGIGVRIEDDVLVTPTGHQVLSHAVPKAADDLLALRAT